MRCATFNVLADTYLKKHGDYSHVDPELLLPNARTDGIVALIGSLGAEVVGLQEVEEPLLRALQQTGNWQTFWSQKGRGKPDGCLTLVRPEIHIEDDAFDTHHFSDQSGHVMQTVRIGDILFSNTHIKWAPLDDPEHAGIKQTTELISRLGAEQKVVIFGDYNDEPYGPVRQLVETAGFTHVNDEEPTAIVNQRLLSLDLLAVRGVTATRVASDYDLTAIPNRNCPSDHIPVLADLEFN